MNRLEQEFLDLLTDDIKHSQCGVKNIDKFWKWINQNYISKEEILNLECLKEENYPEGQWKPYPLQARNKLRNEIKKEIEKL